MKSKIAVWFLAMVAGLCSTASAWNDSGHMTIALLAWRELNEFQQNECAALLKSHPHYELFLSDKKPEEIEVGQWAFMRASTWPDFVRPSRPGDKLFKDATITRFHRGPWHYIDVPYNVGGFVQPPSTQPASTPSENVITALERQTRIFSDRTAAAADRAVALCWILHLIGDLHQPMHACTMYSDIFPKGDKGGNETAIRVAGNTQKLHAFWDDILGTSDAFTALDFQARQIANSPLNDVKKLPEVAADQTPEAWIARSHEYAVALAYLNGRLPFSSWAEIDSKEITAEEVPPAPPSYLPNAQALARERAALASHRTARTIQDALK